MTITLELEPDLEQDLLAQAREQGVSLDAFLQEMVRKQARVATVPTIGNGKVPELPIRQLGAVGSLHRRDIYEDVD